MPTEGECKWDRYEAHRADGACKACHEQMDPIGFGLENYDLAGRFRTVEEAAPQCTITGEGELVGVGSFRGPAELSDLLLQNGGLGGCIVDQLYRFAMGHEIADEDVAFTETLATSFADDNHRFQGLLMELIANDAFAYRREE